MYAFYTGGIALSDAGKIILASNSPRRRELLAQMGVSFCVETPDVDEEDAATPEGTVRALSDQKARAVAERHFTEDALILAADTVVFCEGILGKPKDSQDAARMLRLLSGRWHDVYTGVCLMRTPDMRAKARVERTRVHFTHLTDAQIARYVQTGEPMDKAGAYALQGQAGMFIDRIEGSASNVIGLPMAAVRDLLCAYEIML